MKITLTDDGLVTITDDVWEYQIADAHSPFHGFGGDLGHLAHGNPVVIDHEDAPEEQPQTESDHYQPPETEMLVVTFDAGMGHGA